jgi:hypothetical protein
MTEKGLRYNANKPRMDFIDADAAIGLARVLTFGANKYSPNNWRNGLSFTETIGSLERHIAAIKRGELVDSESGEHHIDHVQCNAMFLSFFMKHPELYERFNDIWTPSSLGLKHNPEEK